MDRLPPTERALGPVGEAPALKRESAPEVSRDIGPYRLLQMIGEGGMGEVWLAEQTAPVRRTVALKVIKRGMDTRRVIQRFQAERQALAMMDHPAIARVFDAGETPRGRPYFVMEHVRGVPITQYCDRHRLTTRERLALFIQVCDGVQHAHHKAILHRDLKPSNILVTEQDGKPVPKIIDFGVAKATAQPLTQETMYTELGQLIGTPEYMSPEQADLTGEDVDTRTDVYSLGVVLYQLLVGALPLDSGEMQRAGLDGVRHILRDQDPARPSTRVATFGDASAAAAANRRTEPPALARLLTGDLDWITMKALDKDRGRRYGSPHELAADLGRYLRNEPVEARPPTTAYRMAKFTRRHRTGVSVATILVVLLIAFAVAMAVQARRIAHERDRKESALSEAEAVTGFLTNMLAAVDPGKERRDVMVREVLDKASTRLGESFADQPAVEARLESTIGKSYSALGVFDAAEDHFRAAYETRLRLLGPDDPETLQAGIDLATALFNRGRFAAAEQLHRKVLESRRRLLGDDASPTLWSISNLAITLAAQGRYAEAEPLLVEALAARRRMLGLDSVETLSVLNNLATVYHRLGRHGDAEPLYREALAAYERVDGPRHPRTLLARNNLAELYADEGQTAEAEPLLLDVLEVKREVLGADHPSALYTAGVLAKLYRTEGRFDRAEPLLLGTLEGQRRRLGADHQQTLATLHELACLRAAQGRPDEALELLGQALKPDLETRDPFADPALQALDDDLRLAALEAAWRAGHPQR